MQDIKQREYNTNEASQNLARLNAELSDKEKSNALNEIRILASVQDKNVISYKEAFFDEKNSSLGIVMEYADKGDLFQLISERNC